jgi:hypothetical protein
MMPRVPEVRLIDEILPAYDVAKQHELVVEAPPERTWRALLEADLRDPVIVRALMFLRGYGRRAGRQRQVRTLPEKLASLGFVRLGERPGEEIVFGLVGRFWTPGGGLRSVRAEEFLGIREEGLAKAAWNLAVEPRGASACRLSTETRVLCFGASARRRFRAYWAIIGPFSGIIRIAMLRSIRERALSKGAAE